MLTRRKFVSRGMQGVSAMIGALALPAQLQVLAEESANSPDGLPILKSVKWGMIQVDGSVADKFALMKSLGYDGMELESPIGLDPKEVTAASEKTGMPVHGVVNMQHWSVRLSEPDPARREESRQILERCLHEAKSFGGHSVLLVPGQVSGADENHDHVWQRSIEQIRKVLPVASRLGVRILIENVWNGFCETPDEFCDYLDEIDSPWVGAYFDIGNVRKFGPSEDWIRALGPRIVKLDVKDWSQAEGFCKIGDGDVHWSAVREALAEIGYTGWSTAEVAGGDGVRLADILARMRRVLDTGN